jgi:hypothetical protein
MKDKFLPIPLYADEPTSDIVKGVLIRLLFSGIGYGLSAKIMGKEFGKYALYGGMWAIGSNLAAIAFTKYRMREDA